MESGPSKTESIEVAAEQLLKSNLVAIPTETVYGLAAIATNLAAVARVFELKDRPLDHPLIVHCGSAEQAWKCAGTVSESARKLAKTFWPGPLTLVVSRNEQIDPRITGGQDSVALRIPAHPLTLKLLKSLDRPVVAPSANRFGRVSPTTAAHVADEFAGKDLTILDGGPCQVGIESTIVDCRDDQHIRVLRPGKITEPDIAAAIGVDVGLGSEPTKTVRVSGSLPSHYSPDAKVVLLESEELQPWLQEHQDIQRAMLISPSVRPGICSNKIVWKNVTPDVEEFARELYGLLRKADMEGFELVVVELPLARGIGTAIRDRLKRAAAEE